MLFATVLLRTSLVSLALAGCLSAQESPHEEYRFARENVLGTSCEILVDAPDAETAGAVEAAVLAEIERLNGILSAWDDGSELSRAVASGEPVEASADLLAVLRACDHWREQTGGAFHPGIARLADLWRAAAEHGQPPGEAELAAAVHALGQPAWTIAGDRVTIKMPVTLDALAKGYVLDRASAAGNAAAPGARVVVLDIGGDLRLAAAAPRRVAVRDPRHPADNAEPLCQLHVRSGGVATSGSYARGFEIGGVRHSHVFDPRTGSPADAVLGATVVAVDATTADALATSLCVLGPEAGLAALAAAGAEGVIVTADGEVHQSPGFAALTAGAGDDVAAIGAAASRAAWPAGFELEVSFTIRGRQSGRRRGGWRRPYVAAWIADTEGQPVRTLCLWIDRTRWLPELRQWYRTYRKQQRDLVDAVSQATRRAGDYVLVWGGTDEGDKAVPPGDYVLYLEAAREHGTHQLIKQAIRIGTEPFEISLEGNVEIESAKLRYGKGLFK